MTLRPNVNYFQRVIGDKRGVALFYAIMFLLFLIPIVFVFSKQIQTQTKFSTREKMLKTTRTLATNAMVDFMRQFSQNHYVDYLSTSTLTRTEAFYDAGFTSVQVTTHNATQSLHVTATSRFGDAGRNTDIVRKLEADVLFISDITQFGTLITNPFTITGNPDYIGPYYWTGGHLSVSGNAQFTQGNLVVSGGGTPPTPANITTTSGGTITFDNENIFCLGTISGNITQLGTVNRFTYVPTISMPVVNIAYYQDRQNYSASAANGMEYWLFLNNGTMQVFDCPSPGNTVLRTTIAFPPTGAILLAPNTRLWIAGTLRGRVTIVCTGPLAATAISGTSDNDLNIGNSAVVRQGDVVVRGSFQYSNGMNSADVNHSLSILVTNGIVFHQLANTNMIVNGLFYPDPNDPTARLFAVKNNGSDRQFILFGCRKNKLTLTNKFTSISVEYNFDPNLQRFPSPGLPKRPVLTNMKMRN